MLGAKDALGLREVRGGGERTLSLASSCEEEGRGLALGSWASVSSPVKLDLLFPVLRKLPFGRRLEFFLWHLWSPILLRGANVGLGEVLILEFSLLW